MAHRGAGDGPATGESRRQPRRFRVTRRPGWRVCTTGDHPPFVVDVTVVLPHNPDVPGDHVPDGMAAANKAVAGERAKYGVNHILTTGSTSLLSSASATSTPRPSAWPGHWGRYTLLVRLPWRITSLRAHRTRTVWKPEERAAPWQAGS